MKPESCSFTQTCHAANWLFSTRGTSTRGLHRSSSPAISRLRGQPQPQGTPNHSSAISLQTVPQRSTTSHASVAEAPIQNEAFEARHADKSAKSSSNNRKTQKQSAVQTPASQQNQLESLGLLEWPELCQQVNNWRHFCRTHGISAFDTICSNKECMLPATSYVTLHCIVVLIFRLESSVLLHFVAHICCLPALPTYSMTVFVAWACLLYTQLGFHANALFATTTPTPVHLYSFTQSACCAFATYRAAHMDTYVYATGLSPVGVIHMLNTQVASFTSTAVAAEIALAARLPMAATQQQAEQLLQETAEAQQANLALKGIHDLRGLLEAVGRDRVLQPIYLDGVASSLEVLNHFTTGSIS